MLPATRFLTSILALSLAAVMPSLAGAQGQAPPAEGSEAELIAVLESDARLFDKAKACQQLAVIGTAKAVPALAELLSDESLAHYARFGLEPIPDPAVDDALREAAGKLQGGLLVGVINSIGMRRDAGAVDQLKGLMESSDTTVAAAAAAALGRIATPEAVEALEEALGGPAPRRLAVADACLTAADRLLGEGEKDEAASLYEAMRAADLPKHLQIAALYGIVRARGAEALPLVVECLRSDDKARFRVALDAAQALPGEEVTEAVLAELSEPLPAAEAPPKVLVIDKAEYGAQDKWVDVTDKLADAVTGNGISVTSSNALAGDPIHGVVKQLRVEYTLGGEKKTAVVPEGEQFEVQGDMAQHPRRALLIYVLGERGDQTALPVVLEAAESGPWDVRVAAARALAKLPSVSAVPVLLKTAVEAQGELAEAARDSLAEVPCQQVDAKLADALAESEGNRLLVVIGLVGRRGVTSAVPTLLELADSDDDEIRLAAIGALGSTVGLDKLSALIDCVVSPSTPEVASAAKEALRKACMRMPDRDAAAAELIDRMATAPTAAQVDLLDMLGVLGGAKALEGVAQAAKGANEALQDAATRVLGEWLTPDAAPVLLELASSGNDKFKIRCLRGYIRIPRQLDVPLDERAAMCRKALAVAERDEERKLVLEVLARYPSRESLDVALSVLETATLKQAAAQTAVKIAEKIADSEPAAVADAMQNLLEAGVRGGPANRAKALLEKVGK
jgi:HEAT repeat protein